MAEKDVTEKEAAAKEAAAGKAAAKREGRAPYLRDKDGMIYPYDPDLMKIAGMEPVWERPEPPANQTQQGQTAEPMRVGETMHAGPGHRPGEVSRSTDTKK